MHVCCLELARLHVVVCVCACAGVCLCLCACVFVCANVRVFACGVKYVSRITFWGSTSSSVMSTRADVDADPKAEDEPAPINKQYEHDGKEKEEPERRVMRHMI